MDHIWKWSKPDKNVLSQLLLLERKNSNTKEPFGNLIQIQNKQTNWRTRERITKERNRKSDDEGREDKSGPNEKGIDMRFDMVRWYQLL